MTTQRGPVEDQREGTIRSGGGGRRSFCGEPTPNDRTRDGATALVDNQADDASLSWARAGLGSGFCCVLETGSPSRTSAAARPVVNTSAAETVSNPRWILVMVFLRASSSPATRASSVHRGVSRHVPSNDDGRRTQPASGTASRVRA